MLISFIPFFVSLMKGETRVLLTPLYPEKEIHG